MIYYYVSWVCAFQGCINIQKPHSYPTFSGHLLWVEGKEITKELGVCKSESSAPVASCSLVKSTWGDALILPNKSFGSWSAVSQNFSYILLGIYPERKRVGELFYCKSRGKGETLVRKEYDCIHVLRGFSHHNFSNSELQLLKSIIFPLSDMHRAK